MPTVVLISTDDAARVLFTTVLECAGHTVRQAGTLDEGLGFLSREAADVVVLALQSEESDVVQAVGRLRVHSAVIRIVVVLTQTDDAMDFLAVRLAGADDLLKPPMNTRTLLDAINQAFHADDIL
jgi:DNA-binding response OmpR family regulator